MSVNVNNFFRGTDFGFSTGSQATASDNHPAMDEAGDATEKLQLIRKVIVSQFPQLNPPEVPAKKGKLGDLTVNLKALGNLFATEVRSKLSSKTVSSTNPVSFEEFGQSLGFLLYEASLPQLTIDPAELTVNGLADRAMVYVDDLFVGILSKDHEIQTLSLNAASGSKLRILVENPGRSENGEKKGILERVTVSTFEAGKVMEITSWTVIGFPLTNQDQINTFVRETKGNSFPIDTSGMLNDGPVLLLGEIVLASPLDTYLDTTGWGKGSVFVNGFNLGRYWSSSTTQKTLFIPKELLKEGTNELVMLELQRPLSFIRLVASP